MKIFKTISVGLVVMLISVSGHTVSAQDNDKGYEAYQSGDYQTALNEWLPLAEQGNAWTQNKMGTMYGLGQGVTQDYAEAVKWYRLAAEQGYAIAQYNLGVMYNNGLGVTQDDAEAVKWYRLAAEQGYVIAQNNLGVTYYNGQGAIQDNVYAHMWWNIAASLGHENASENRGIVASQMTAAQIAKAQDLARECVARNYKGC